jgi:Asp/Glu/hydantoin racemase
VTEQQPSLDFDALQPGETIIRNPMCIWDPPCAGIKARLGVPVVNAAGTCENRTIECLQCGRRVGVQSTNLETT